MLGSSVFSEVLTDLHSGPVQGFRALTYALGEARLIPMLTNCTTTANKAAPAVVLLLIGIMYRTLNYLQRRQPVPGVKLQTSTAGIGCRQVLVQCGTYGRPFARSLC